MGLAPTGEDPESRENKKEMATTMDTSRLDTSVLSHPLASVQEEVLDIRGLLEQLKLNDKSDESPKDNLIKVLRKALTEVLDQNQDFKDQNERLQAQNRDLLEQNATLREEGEQKDQAIMELAGIVNNQMGGQLYEDLNQM